MARYIDAEKLINNIDALVINSQDVMFIRKLIADLETEDVKPVVHTRWVTLASGVDCICNHCSHYWIAVDEKYDFKYCPNCGAKMDSDVDG